jgi:hypothetical protein
MTPRSEALAFRIWAYANPLGWDCSAKDIAEALGETWHRVVKVLQLKGWSHRIRRDSAEYGVGSGYLDFDATEPTRGEIVQRLRREADL